MDEEQLKWLAIVVAVILGVGFLPMVIWAIATRPSWWRLKNDIYFALSGFGLVFVRIPTKSPGYNGMMSPGIPE